MKMKKMVLAALAAFGLAVGSLGLTATATPDAALTAQPQDCTVTVDSGGANVDVNWC